MATRRILLTIGALIVTAECVWLAFGGRIYRYTVAAITCVLAYYLFREAADNDNN